VAWVIAVIAATLFILMWLASLGGLARSAMPGSTTTPTSPVAAVAPR